MNNEEFKEFYIKYYEFSVRMARKVVKDYSTAEDVAQEVFCYLYKIRERLDKNEKRLHVLIGLESVNKGRDYLRKSHVKRELPSPDTMTEYEQERTSESVEAAVLRMEQREYIRLVFEKLRNKNPKNYDIYVKVKAWGVPPEEVAEEYHITRSNVNNRILRTRYWLKAELDKLNRDT